MHECQLGASTVILVSSSLGPYINLDSISFFKNIYKVIDLGYAKQADQAGLCHSYVGTPCYLVSLIAVYPTTTLFLRSLRATIFLVKGRLLPLIRLTKQSTNASS